MCMRSILQSRSVAFAAVALATCVCGRVVFGADIHEAARAGNAAEVAALLKDNPGLTSSTDGDGLTPLHWAAHAGRTEVVAVLLANHADVNALAGNGFTPLHHAAFAGHKDAA